MISSAPARRETKLAVMELFPNAGLFELYGSTEAGWVTILQPEDQLSKLGSVGRECVGTRPVRLLDPDGREVADGEVGELYSWTPYTFDGYWRLPEKTAEAFNDGYCSVGDMARRDEDGFLYLVDRKSNMIISGGENVYPSEVEAALAAHPAVREVAVIGLPDAKWGERVHAVVAFGSEATATAEDLIGWCKARLAGYKRPRSISIVSVGGTAEDGDGQDPAPAAEATHPGEGAREMTGPIDLGAGERTAAAWIAKFLQRRGIDRVFGLQGGHIQPIWDWLGRLGIRIIDVRDEGAAVHMAHAHAELTGGFGVAMATAGPGVTNCVTAVANAALARAPVLLIGGCPPRPQVNMGPLQDIPHADILRPVTRHARTLRVADQVLRELDEAVARAMGDLGEPGPVYLEIPTDVLREDIPPALVLDDWLTPKPPRVLAPDPAAVEEAARMIWRARRPLVITGRGARGAEAALVRLLDASGALYLDTQESRGLVPLDHPSFAGAVRAQAMTEADLVVVVGRKLDYQLGYGSPAVFPNARFIRIADTAGELIDNRRGAPEILATPALALEAIVEVMGNAEAEPRYRAGPIRCAGASCSAPPRASATRPRSGRTARSIRAASSMPSPRSRPPTTSRSLMAATC